LRHVVGTEGFLRYVKDDGLYAAWTLFLVLGMRRGEVAGLRWSNVDIEDATERPQLRVAHTRVVGGDNKAITSIPKTDSSGRPIDLDAGLVSVLRAHRSRQREQKMANRPAWTDSGYVFVRPDGLPPHPGHFSARFDKLIAQGLKDGVDVHRIRPHDCRHSAATGLINGGTPVKVVSEILGHADVRFTLSTYAHCLPTMGATAVAGRSAKLLGDVPP
jgi:integrase